MSRKAEQSASTSSGDSEIREQRARFGGGFGKDNAECGDSGGHVQIAVGLVLLHRLMGTSFPADHWPVLFHHHAERASRMLAGSKSVKKKEIVLLQQKVPGIWKVEGD